MGYHVYTRRCREESTIMFKKVDPSMDFPRLEQEILDRWRREKVFEESVTRRKGAPKFVFFEGPPTANGLPHPGHVETRAMKDVVLRYKTMKGFYVPRKAGWDTHGLPVELEVEKELGISGKPQIEEFGVEEFIKRCKASVFKYEQEWRRMTERLGFWLDMDDPYITYHDTYIESVWWAVKTIYEKGLLYRGHKVVPYCPRCGTALSSHEVAQGYREVTDPSLYVRFPVRGQEKAFFLAWTTTPWTLPSNAALAVSADAEYAYVRAGDETLIMAKELVEGVVSEPCSIERVVKGSELVGAEYEPLFAFVEPEEPAWRVVAADFVSLEDGTGIVHIAPAFGEDDMRVGVENGLPVIQLVNAEGRFDERVPQWAGMFVKEADPLIMKDLESRGLIFKVAQCEHTYPFCWRCDTPLLYYARASWFIKMSSLREQLLANNSEISWYPEYIRDGRFGNFLDNVVDWAVSRERYWGTPLPIWICEDCRHQHVVGSVAELRGMARTLPEHFELHRPYIDQAVLTCPECGGDMRRVPEVMDCWFDSGSMPFAQWHYPFENQKLFEESFPADFITEAVDQTRGWFYTLLAISTLLFGRAPFKNCVVLGLVVDEEGLKMSKSKGNVIDVWGLFNKQGADAVRWYLYTVNAPWTPKRFYQEGVTEAMRRFMGTLWNVYSFYVLYANLDGFDPGEHHVPLEQRPLIDRWLLSRLSRLCTQVTELMDAYDITAAARRIEQFVDELSNWYVRRNRRRYWGSEMSMDKEAAYLTLHEALVTVAKLAAPFTPFIAEEIFSNLEQGRGSVHLQDYPAGDPAVVDLELEQAMDLARQVVYLGRAARNAVNIKNRQPLSKIVVALSGGARDAVGSLEDVIMDELNVKAVEYADDMGEFVSYKVKPKFDVLGPKYGRMMKGIAAALAVAAPEEVARAVLAGSEYRLTLEDGSTVALLPEEVVVETMAAEGFCVQSESSVAVALDTTITEELRMEGFARELVNKIQTSRKEAGFEVSDRIHTVLEGEGDAIRAAEAFRDRIMAETLSLSLSFGEACGEFVKEWDVNGERVAIGVARAR